MSQAKRVIKRIDRVLPFFPHQTIIGVGFLITYFVLAKILIPKNYRAWEPIAGAVGAVLIAFLLKLATSPLKAPKRFRVERAIEIGLPYLLQLYVLSFFGKLNEAPFAAVAYLVGEALAGSSLEIA